jgi:hypothetical protein
VTLLLAETISHVMPGLADAYTQVNMYQNGGRPAAASYKAYLFSDAAAGRADGYGLREWRHDPSGALWSVSGSAVSFIATSFNFPLTTVLY